MILKSFIANLPFSPAVAGQIGFYTRRLAREEFTRRLGLIFMSAALMMQSLVLISPPQATIAAGPNNIIFQGVTSKDDLLNRYDTNNDGNGHMDLQQIFTQFGISRDDLAGGSIETINSRDQNLKLWSIGRFAYNKSGEYAQPIDGTDTTVYVRPLWSWDTSTFGSNYQALTGTTSDGRYFAVLLNCGNLVINIGEEETPEEPVGFVQHDCDAIRGWVYDPNDTTKKTKVTVWVSLEKDGGSVRKQLIADDESPSSPQGPGYGFNFAIPDEKKSDTLRTMYTVVAHDDTGEAKDVDLARNVVFSAPCLDPPEEPEEENPPLAKLVKNQCRCIEGWAYDPDNINETVEVRMKLELEDGSVEASDWQYVTANQEKPAVGVGGSHGFKFDIEDEEFDTWKSSDTATLATVQIKDVDTDEWITLADKQVLDPNPCLEEETQEEPEYCEFNEALLADDPRCRECPYVPGLWIDSTECNEPFALVLRSKTARNVTQDIDDANGTTAQPGDIIEYSLTAQNIGNIVTTVDLNESLIDVLEYADFVEAAADGIFDAEEKTVEWESVELEPDGFVTRTVTVQVKDEIPATPASVGDPESFNLTMTNVFGDDSVEIKVTAPVTKQVEMVVKELPNTGAGTNVVVMSVTGFLVIYMYLRNRQISKELRLVRSEYNLGAA